MARKFSKRRLLDTSWYEYQLLVRSFIKDFEVKLREFFWDVFKEKQAISIDPIFQHMFLKDRPFLLLLV